MVSKFKSLSVLVEILARGQFWESIPTLEAISASEAVRSGELPIYQRCGYVTQVHNFLIYLFIFLFISICLLCYYIVIICFGIY